MTCADVYKKAVLIKKKCLQEGSRMIQLSMTFSVTLRPINELCSNSDFQNKKEGEETATGKKIPNDTQNKQPRHS